MITENFGTWGRKFPAHIKQSFSPSQQDESCVIRAGWRNSAERLVTVQSFLHKDYTFPRQKKIERVSLLYFYTSLELTGIFHLGWPAPLHKVRTREYWMIYRGPGFLILSSPVGKVDWRHTGSLRKVDNLMTWGGGGGAKSYDSWKAWSSTYKSLKTLCSSNWGWINSKLRYTHCYKT